MGSSTLRLLVVLPGENRARDSVAITIVCVVWSGVGLLLVPGLIVVEQALRLWANAVRTWDTQRGLDLDGHLCSLHS
jgi:hypothetical protein